MGLKSEELRERLARAEYLEVKIRVLKKLAKLHPNRTDIAVELKWAEQFYNEYGSTCSTLVEQVKNYELFQKTIGSMESANGSFFNFVLGRIEYGPSSSRNTNNIEYTTAHHERKLRYDIPRGRYGEEI